MVFQLICILLGTALGVFGFIRFRKEHKTKAWLLEHHSETISETHREQQEKEIQRLYKLSWLCLAIAVILPIGWFLAIL